MSLEQALQENTAAIKALVVAIGSMGALTPVADAATAPAPKPEKKETKAEKKAEAPAVETKKEVTWAETLDVIKKVNASETAGCGRAGVTAILEKFGKAGEKVPALESVGKHAEIKAFAQSLLDGKTEAEGDDLGI